MSGSIEYPEQIAVLLCREMKWTWEEYLSQPVWFVRMLILLMQAEGEHIKRQQKQS